MMPSAMIALIRDGETTLYRDTGGAALFPRNLVWGQDAMEQWLLSKESEAEFDCECAAGAVVDFDAQALLWYTECDPLKYPRSVQLYDALLKAAWPGFEIIYGDGLSDLQVAAGGTLSSAEDRQLRLREMDGDRLANREDFMTDVNNEEHDFDPEDDEERVAWITLLDQNDTIHHHLIEEITLDLIWDENNPLFRLLQLSQQGVPKERIVAEGMLVDEANQQISLWGPRSIRDVAKEMASHWPDWSVSVIESDGYQHQCQFSGPSGQPLSDAEAMANVIQILLTTKQVDPAAILGEVGKSVKGCLARMVAGLTALICFPFFVFALVSGNWKTGAIAIGIIVLIVMVAFKLIERKWRRGFQAKMANAPWNLDADETEGPQVAGPIDSSQRRSRLEDLLKKAGLPSIPECEPHFDPDLATLYGG